MSTAIGGKSIRNPLIEVGFGSIGELGYPMAHLWIYVFSKINASYKNAVCDKPPKKGLLLEPKTRTPGSVAKYQCIGTPKEGYSM